jgi:hypothetical protein
VFEYCSKLETLVLHAGISSIGEYAFRGCDVLGNITFPTSLENLGQHAFAGSNSSNSKRTEIVLSSTKLKSIAPYAFQRNFAVRTIGFPNMLEDIGDSAYQFNELDTISFPNTLKSIGNYAFEAGVSSGLETVIFPASVERIGVYAFRSHAEITSVTLPADIGSIGSTTFLDCSSLAKFVLSGTGPLSVTGGGGLLIQGNAIIARAPASSGGEITLPEGIIEIGPDIFSGSKYTKITMPVSLERISGNYIFNNCSDLEEIVFPEGCNLTSISGSYMLSGCTKLKSIDFSNTRLQNFDVSYFFHSMPVNSSVFESCILPDTVKTIGGNVVSTVKSGFTLTIYATNPPTATTTAIVYPDEVSNIAAIYVPAGSINAYKEAAGWSIYADKFAAIED